jgi:hypothetical protein
MGADRNGVEIRTLPLIDDTEIAPFFDHPQGGRAQTRRLEVPVAEGTSHFLVPEGLAHASSRMARERLGPVKNLVRITDFDGKG